MIIYRRHERELTKTLKNVRCEQKCCLKEYIDKNTESCAKASIESSKQLPENMFFSFYGKIVEIIKKNENMLPVMISVLKVKVNYALLFWHCILLVMRNKRFKKTQKAKGFEPGPLPQALIGKKKRDEYCFDFANMEMSTEFCFKTLL